MRTFSVYCRLRFSHAPIHRPTNGIRNFIESIFGGKENTQPALLCHNRKSSDSGRDWCVGDRKLTHCRLGERVLFDAGPCAKFDRRGRMFVSIYFHFPWIYLLRGQFTLNGTHLWPFLISTTDDRESVPQKSAQHHASATDNRRR